MLLLSLFISHLHPFLPSHFFFPFSSSPSSPLSFSPSPLLTSPFRPLLSSPLLSALSSPHLTSPFRPLLSSPFRPLLSSPHLSSPLLTSPHLLFYPLWSSSQLFFFPLHPFLSAPFSPPDPLLLSPFFLLIFIALKEGAILAILDTVQKPYQTVWHLIDEKWLIRWRRWTDQLLCHSTSVLFSYLSDLLCSLSYISSLLSCVFFLLCYTIFFVGKEGFKKPAKNL